MTERELLVVHVDRLEDAPAAVALAHEARRRGTYLDTSSVEYCTRCRCKTLHVVDPSSGERACEWHQQEERST